MATNNEAAASGPPVSDPLASYREHYAEVAHSAIVRDAWSATADAIQKIAAPTPPAPAVRCFKDRTSIDVRLWAMTSATKGVFFNATQQYKFPATPTLSILAEHENCDELSPDAALAELADWPEAQRELRRMMGFTPDPAMAAAALEAHRRGDSLTTSEYVAELMDKRSAFLTGLSTQPAPPEVSPSEYTLEGIPAPPASVPVPDDPVRCFTSVDGSQWAMQGDEVISRWDWSDGPWLTKGLKPGVPVPDAGERVTLKAREFPYVAACSGLRYENPGACDEVSAIVLDGKRWEVRRESDKALLEALRSLGMPDDAEPGEWVGNMQQRLADSEIERLASEHSATRWRERCGEAVTLKSIYHKSLQRVASLIGYDVPVGSRETAWAGMVQAVEAKMQSLQAAEARAAELSRELESVKAERDSANAACNEVLNSLEWQGDGYSWNPPNGDYRESPMVALSRGQRKHVEALAALRDRLAELEREKRQNVEVAEASEGVLLLQVETLQEQLTAAQARIAELEREREGLAALAGRWKAESHAPTGEAYLVTKTSMANELIDALDAAAQLADAKGGGE